MAWLWTVAETWNAAERTFESALNLQKDFPELIFCHSTPALYEWIGQNRPALFERIQQAIAAGWWEPVGGLWIEPELNLISGESIVRQVLYGQRYFQEKFGSINRMAWLPDTFGFTWQLPQILKQGGIDYFVTQKLRWNDTTKFPYEVFQWQAPDRTEIFSLMSAPIGEGIDPIKMATYACDWETKTGIPDVLWLPGVGDHGGGPTRDMLEVVRRWQRSPFFPQLEFSTTLNYLQDLEANYKPDSASSFSADALNIVNAPQSINAEPQTFNDEPLSISREPQSISAEPQSINAEPQTFTSESQSINAKVQSIMGEPQSINADSQNLELKTQNSKLFPPYSPLPTPHSLPSWDSDLYLEFHRGCYTTHADQKLYNRQSEALLYQAELWASLATISAGVEYPKAELENAWKKVLFNQFHDILPGSSITKVFADANEAWEEAKSVGQKVLSTSLHAIAQQIALPSPPHPNARAIVVFNPCSWERSAIVNTSPFEELSDAAALTAFEKYGQDGVYPWQICALDGQEVEAPYCPFHKASDHYGWGLTFLADNIPALGYRCFWMYPRLSQYGGRPEERWILENEFLRVTVDPTTGDLANVFDKINQWEVLKGKGNQLQAFRDEGQYWDAWNIDPNYESHPLLHSELISISPRDELCVGETRLHNQLGASISVERKIGQSVFLQMYILERKSPVLKIQTVVDWQERHVLVKAAFLLNLEADFANYEIPCGVIERSTKSETEAEKAQWEVPAMHWADLSDGNYGVSLLNDCKYGYDAKPNQLRLTLLRGSEWPDPEADKGQHFFTYALYPHAGDWKAAQTVKHGYELNMPLIAQVIPTSGDDRPKTLPPTGSLLDLGADNLVLMAFKQSEDSPDEWILRCYECHGEPAQLNFQSDLGLELGERVDLLERSTDVQTTKGQTVTVRPWEIASFKVKQSATSGQPSVLPQA
ncbi:MAG: alpha-mannosidase [Stenomitos frigidus ULC029]